MNKARLLASLVLLSQTLASAQTPDAMDAIDSAGAFGPTGLSMHEIVRDSARSVFQINVANDYGAPDESSAGTDLDMLLVCAPAKIAARHGYKSFDYALDIKDRDGAFVPAPDGSRLGQQQLFETVIWFGDAYPDQPFVTSSSGARIDVATITKKCDEAAARMAPATNAPTPTPDPSSQNCNGRGPMLAPAAPQEFGASVVAPTIPSEVKLAIADGERRINGELDPEYLNSPRVVVHPDSAPDGVTTMVVVPPGVVAAIGQHVTYRTGYADPDRACHYLPNLIKRRANDERAN